MRVLITGNLGFVGSETERYLKEKGHEVVGYDLMHGYDIRDVQQFYTFCKQTRPDRILHLAAIARFHDCDKNPRLAFETNVIGTANVAKVAARLHIPLVYASTGSVYMPIKNDPPITELFPAQGNSQYACTKFTGEIYVKEVTPHIILRYAHLYGPEKRNDGLIGNFFSRIQRGLAPELYGGKQSSDFTYIKDIAQANWLALSASWDKWGETYNIGTGEELTAERAGQIICDLTGWKGGMIPGKAREVDASRFVFDISKARTKLGYDPKYTFERGLKEMFK